MVAADPANFTLALEAKDAAPIAAAGKRVVFMSIENAYPLGEDVSLLKTFYDMGVRVVGFAHFAHNQFVDSSTDPSKKPRFGGLSRLGKDLLKEMNRLGIVPDASHSSEIGRASCRVGVCKSVLTSVFAGYLKKKTIRAECYNKI